MGKHEQGKLKPRVNQAINAEEVHFIDHDGVSHGNMPLQQALQLARDAGFDLVEMASNSQPPVCKAIDYGRYRYQAQKKMAESRKKQKKTGVKEMRLRPAIDVHDYNVKLRNIRRFITDGDKVKVTLRFRGRELSHQQQGFDLLDKVKNDTADIAKIEYQPKFEGRQIIMVMSPK